MDLRPAISLKARVIYVKKLRKGDSAGCNRAYLARDDVWVATLPLAMLMAGLAPPHSLTKKAPRSASTVSFIPSSRPSPPATVSWKSAAKSAVKIGDTATFFDWQTGSRPEDVAEFCGASVYDLTMHLNPLLPRRIIR